MHANTLAPVELQNIDAYWRAANYLAVGQIYLFDNPLLKRPLVLSDIKRMLLGHWGTTPGQNFIYVHLNRVIRKFDLDMIYVSGPGHGGPAMVDGVPNAGTFRSHQVPLTDFASRPEHLAQLEQWLRSYTPMSCSIMRAVCGRNWRILHRLAHGAWVPIRTQSAVCCCAICTCPNFAIMPSP